MSFDDVDDDERERWSQRARTYGSVQVCMSSEAHEIGSGNEFDWCFSIAFTLAWRVMSSPSRQMTELNFVWLCTIFCSGFNLLYALFMNGFFHPLPTTTTSRWLRSTSFCHRFWLEKLFTLKNSPPPSNKGISFSCSTFPTLTLLWLSNSGPTHNSSRIGGNCEQKFSFFSCCGLRKATVNHTSEKFSDLLPSLRMCVACMVNGRLTCKECGRLNQKILMEMSLEVAWRIINLFVNNLRLSTRREKEWKIWKLNETYESMLKNKYVNIFKISSIS